MPAFFTQELETVATYWRIYRKDGVAMGFTSHDRDIDFDGITHRAAPGMVPSAIRLTRDLKPDSAEVQGALSHDAIAADDLANGLFDNARVEIGAVDWGTNKSEVIYVGTLSQISEDGSGFKAELASAKSALTKVPAPRTSPTCRAEFCGRECGLSRPRFMHLAVSSNIDPDANHVSIAGIDHSKFTFGQLRFLSGPQTGVKFGIVEAIGSALVLDRPLAASTPQSSQVELLEGCDHLLTTCHSRFGNARNFRGEPFLPGNDLVARYPKPQ